MPGLVSSRWTMSPFIQWTSGESNPDLLGCKPGVFPLDEPPIFVKGPSGN